MGVIAKGGLALALNGQVMPRKEGAREAVLPAALRLYLTSLLLPPPAWWIPHPQEVTVFWGLWGPGHPLESTPPKVPARKKRHTLKLTWKGNGDMGNLLVTLDWKWEARVLFLADNEQLLRQEANQRSSLCLSLPFWEQKVIIWGLSWISLKWELNRFAKVKHDLCRVASFSSNDYTGSRITI